VGARTSIADDEHIRFRFSDLVPEPPTRQQQLARLCEFVLAGLAPWILGGWLTVPLMAFCAGASTFETVDSMLDRQAQQGKVGKSFTGINLSRRPQGRWDVRRQPA
jgi:hypothetical protein